MRKITIALWAGLFVWGCVASAAASYPYAFAPVRHYHLNALIRHVYAAADQLESNMLYRLDRSQPVLATSFVNFDALDESSTFGRMLGDQIAIRFGQHGYNVLELKLRRDQILVRDGTGELVLSRNLDHIQRQHDIQAVIVGTYTISNDTAFVACKLVRTRDNSVLAGHNFAIYLDTTLKNIAGADQVQRVAASGEGPLASGLILLKTSESGGARLIQARLAELGYYHSKIDGLWQTYSKKALREFKTERKLGYVNQYDLDTQKALFKGTGQ